MMSEEAGPLKVWGGGVGNETPPACPSGANVN